MELYAALKRVRSFSMYGSGKIPWSIKYTKAAEYRVVNVMYYSLCVRGKKNIHIYGFKALGVKISFYTEFFVTRLYIIG